MANYYGTTVCEGGKIKKGKEKEIEKIIAKYKFGTGEGEFSVGVEGGQLYAYGYDSAYAYKINDEDYDEECFDVFLDEIAPFLTTPFIVKEVGNEKCRYICAYAYIVKPNKKCISVSLDSAISKLTKIK